MRHVILAVTASSPFLIAGLPTAAQEALVEASGPEESPVGYWRTISDTNGEPRALVEIVPTPGGTLEAYVRGSLIDGEDPSRPCTECKDELEGVPMMGLRIMWDMEPKDDALRYGGGRILDPDTGNVYKSKLTLADGGDAMKVRGYIGISALGRSQEWLRASPEEVQALMASAEEAQKMDAGLAEAPMDASMMEPIEAEAAPGMAPVGE